MATSEECAKAVMEGVPKVMRTIRAELRKHRTSDLSIPQFRILSFIKSNPEASLSDLADHIGLTLPTISKMVDMLVARQWVTRQTALEDRRRLLLGLTPRGLAMWEQSFQQTQANLAEKLTGLTPDERDAVIEAMHCLQIVFATEREVKAR